ncbi:hypothetical protein OTERR_02950 [Oryzomicrobium terrae]|uniref:DUF484 family protein n=1 Tax=Oryzomicrobium terrae TaxID=1735038 RepID=A0A5C1E4C9_9RHOO|nr:DUF484 family protein [Oryzomicrobium terrae]QEL63771.1 hypothetical protein OTERR_02950 [Oryzomicrobium terrae]
MSASTAALRAEDVAHYLQNHPQFFEDYADLMARVVIPHPHGGRAISITERQMLTLREQSRSLEGRLMELMRYGEQNDAISEKLHRLAVSLVAAASPLAVVNGVYLQLKEDFEIPHVALRLWETPAGLGEGAELPDFLACGEELAVFAETLGKPYCGAAHGFETSSWFGPSAPHIRSQALIALRSGGATLGMIALGSEDAERFYADMGTLYLERLGELVSAAILRVTRPA